VLFAAVCAAIFLQSTLIPTLGLYFNETGHQAYVADNFDRAELMHRMAIGILPDHPVLLDNLGMVYLDEFIKTRKLDHLDQAKSAFESSMAANPHFDIPAGHLETALIQSLTGDFAGDRPIHEKIVAADRHVLAANPFNPFIRRNLAEALYNIGAKDEAAAELQKAIAIEPNYVPGYLRLAEWYVESGRGSEGDEYRRKAVDLVTRYQNAQLSDPFEALLLGRPDSAEQRQ
jgi:tetratricopeptide (TPR) repeat protein